MLEFVLERGNYWAIIGLMMIGLYTLFAATNLIKKLVGLSIFQTSIILFYISLSRIDGGTARGCPDRQAGGTRGPGRVGLPGHAQGTGPASGRQARHAAARQQPLRLQPGHGSASCSPPRRGRAGCTRRWRRRPASAASAGRP